MDHRHQAVHHVVSGDALAVEVPRLAVELQLEVRRLQLNVFPTMDRNRWCACVGAVDRVRPALNVRVAAAAVVREVILLPTRHQRGFPPRRQPWQAIVRRARPHFDDL